MNTTRCQRQWAGNGWNMDWLQFASYWLTTNERRGAGTHRLKHTHRDYSRSRTTVFCKQLQEISHRMRQSAYSTSCTSECTTSGADLQCGCGCLLLVLVKRALHQELWISVFYPHHVQKHVIADVIRAVEGICLAVQHSCLPVGPNRRINSMRVSFDIYRISDLDPGSHACAP